MGRAGAGRGGLGHILAQYDATTVVFYQAYAPAIGRFAAEHGWFGGPRGRERRPLLLHWKRRGACSVAPVVNTAASLLPLVVLLLGTCRGSIAWPDAGRAAPTPASAVSLPAATAPASSAQAPVPSPSTKLGQEGAYWPFAPLPPRIGDVGQGRSTVFAAVPGGTCTHWNCSINFSLVAGCAMSSATADDPCVFGQLIWQTVFGDDDPLVGPVVQLHRGITGYIHRGACYLGGAAIAWPAAGSGVNEVSLRSGDEAHLIALANTLVDAQL